MKRLLKQINPKWPDKNKRLVIARVAKAVVDECWFLVGCNSTQSVSVRVVDLQAFACLSADGVPVNAVTQILTRIIKDVGCDSDDVAKRFAMGLWRVYQRESRPKSLFDYIEA